MVQTNHDSIWKRKKHNSLFHNKFFQTPVKVSEGFYFLLPDQVKGQNPINIYIHGIIRPKEFKAGNICFWFFFFFLLFKCKPTLNATRFGEAEEPLA
jgi:hypothetical protein